MHLPISNFVRKVKSTNYNLKEHFSRPKSFKIANFLNALFNVSRQGKKKCEKIPNFTWLQPIKFNASKKDGWTKFNYIDSFVVFHREHIGL